MKYTVLTSISFKNPFSYFFPPILHVLDVSFESEMFPIVCFKSFQKGFRKIVKLEIKILPKMSFEIDGKGRWKVVKSGTKTL